MSGASGAQTLSGPDDAPALARVTSIPAARKAERVAVITIEGGIDATTAMSVRRRIDAAERAGFDAMVLEIDSPGGELGAVLEISNMIKSSAIINTVGWVRPDAYSGGAIVALACGEIVSSDPASMGDAFVIRMGPGTLRALSPDERTKLLPPLMADVTDSARRSGYDEFLVQAIVVDGVELWQVEDIETGRRLAINEQEYRLLFDGEPLRGKPMLAAVTGGVRTYRDVDGAGGASEPGADQAGNQDEDQGPGRTSDAADAAENQDAPAADPGGAGDQADASSPAGQGPAGDQGPLSDDPNAYRPASETLGDIEREFNDIERSAELSLMNPSQRVAITPGDKGRYRLVGYITDGSSAIVMRDQQLIDFGFSSGIVNTDEELRAFFGAKTLVRANENVFEKMVRFLVHPAVRGVLIVVLLISVFVEMLTAGTGLAGAVALGALVLLLGPGLLIGLSGWWEIIAIIVGIICIAIEAFVTPGFGVFGVIGFVALFGGLIGTFVSAGGSMADPVVQRQLLTGSVTVLLALVTAGIGWWLIVRNMQTLPFFDKLILKAASGVGGQPRPTLLHAIVADDGAVRVGSEGVTTTPLYPIGQADFDGQIEDVHAAFGYIERGVRVRVVRATRMRIEVEEIGDASPGSGPADRETV